MTAERIATAVGPDRVDLCYTTDGDPGRPTVLLVMGIAAQWIHWPDGLVDALVARGLRVVRFDNRDSGRSTHLPGARYTLADMAADAVGLLDALDVRAAHWIGASMGAGIAQMAAIGHPDRVASLTSMMFTTGDMAVGQPHPETLRGLFGGPPVTTREGWIERAVRGAAVAGSPAYPPDRAVVGARAGLAWDRDHDETAIGRQAEATMATGDRTARLREITAPTLVIHGLADTLVDPSGGRATAAAIPGAELVLIEGMGHDLPAALWERLADAIAENVRRGEGQATST